MSAKPKIPMIQLYEYAPRDMVLTTQYGTVPYERWLELEKVRIESTPGRVAEIVIRGRVAALFVNRVSSTTYGTFKKPPPLVRGGPSTKALSKAEQKARLREILVDRMTV